MSQFPLIPVDAWPSEQEVFTVCARWLLTQKEPCRQDAEYDDEGDLVRVGDYCCYRSADGLNACAVGCFMPDDLARKVDLVGEQAIKDVLLSFPQAPAWFHAHAQLLEKLQNIHDAVDAPPLINRLRDLAKERNLTMVEV